MKKLLLLIMVSWVITYEAAAQSSCAQTLRTARATYDEGRLHELPALLEGCIKNGFTQQERVEAYKLLTLSYIYLEESAKADEAMLNLLNTDHYFEINPTTDPAEFVALYRTFRTKPIYRIGATMGANATQPNVINSIETNSGKAKYGNKIAIQAGVTVEIPLTNRLVLNPALQFQQKKFKVSNEIERGTNSLGQKLSNSTTGEENQFWIALPIALQYLISPGRFNPYLELGVSADYLLNSSIALQTVQDGAGIVQQRNLDLKSQREKFNVSAFIGAGGKMRIFGGYVIADVRYLYGVKKINSEATAYRNQSMSFDYNWGDSPFKLNSLMVSVGYIQNIFNPKKLSHR